MNEQTISKMISMKLSGMVEGYQHQAIYVTGYIGYLESFASD